MLKTTETKDEMIIEDGADVQMWDVAALAGLIVAIWWGVSNSDYLSIFIPLIISVAFLRKLLKNQTLVVKIDKKGEIISVRRTTWRKYEFKVYSFKELEGPIYIDQTKRRPIMMPLKDGQKIRLSIDSDETRSSEAAELMNNYVFNLPRKLAASKTSIKP